MPEPGFLLGNRRMITLSPFFTQSVSLYSGEDQRLGHDEMLTMRICKYITEIQYQKQDTPRPVCWLTIWRSKSRPFFDKMLGYSFFAISNFSSPSCISMADGSKGIWTKCPIRLLTRYRMLMVVFRTRNSSAKKR